MNAHNSTVPDANALFWRIQDRIAANEASARRRARWGMTALAGASVIALTGGALAVVQASESSKTVSQCYASSAPGSATTEIAAPPTDGSVRTISDLTARVRLAEEQCAAVWRIGMFTETGPSDSKMSPVPRLFTCLRPDGRLAVYPVDRDSTCDSLGLVDALR